MAASLMIRNHKRRNFPKHFGEAPVVLPFIMIQKCGFAGSQNTNSDYIIQPVIRGIFNIPALWMTSWQTQKRSKPV
jgi:hypothetical protein